MISTKIMDKISLKSIFNSKYNILYFFSAFIIIAFGVFLRLKSYCNAAPIWFDEASLINPILFKPINEILFHFDDEHLFPPLFILLLKLVSCIFGSSELSFRLIPFCFSCASVIAFFFLLKKTFVNKILILSALTLFAFNGMLIYYSQDTRPFSSDVFFCILFLYFSDKIKMRNLKESLLYSIIFASIIFFSYTSVLLVCSIIIKEFLYIKDKRILCLIFPILSIIFSISLLYYSNPTGHYYVMSWHDEIVYKFSFENFIKMIANGLFYFNLYSPIILISFFCGILKLFFGRNTVSIIAFITFVGACLASYMHLYPFAIRFILYLAPIFLIFIFSPADFDYNSNKKFKFLKIAITCFYIIILFCSKPYILDTYPYGSYSPDIQDRITLKNIIINFLDKYKQGDKILITKFYVDTTEYFNYTLNNNQYLDYTYYLSDASTNDIYDMIELNKEKNIWIFGVKDNPESFDGYELETMLKDRGIQYTDYTVNKEKGEYLFLVKNM